MKVAIASGKGGTGKTAVTAALAKVWEGALLAVDLDVEEPNLHLFLKVVEEEQQSAFLSIPRLDKSRCNMCGICAAFCQFKALVSLGKTVAFLPEMCHGCGGCIALCPEKALLPDKRELGDMLLGVMDQQKTLLMGRLRIGEAMAPPLMRQIRSKMHGYVMERNCDVLIDSPPGISCPAMNAVADADIILLVTEPTPFGLFDLKLAMQAFAPLGKPLAVVLNRYGIGSDATEIFCREAGLPIIAKIPFSLAVAEAYAHGRCISEVSIEYADLFKNLRRDIMVLKQKDNHEACHA